MVVARTAGVVPRIGIYARLQSERMDVVRQGPHTLRPFRKSLRMRNHIAVDIPVTEEAVVDVDEVVARVLQTLLNHHVRLMGDD